MAQSISGSPKTTVASTEITTSITEVATALGIKADTCPFEAEHDGFTLDADTNTWACTTCGIEGGVVELVVCVLGVSRRHAKELLRAGTQALKPPSTQGPTAGSPEGTTRRFIDSDLDPDDDDQAMFGKVVSFYTKTLLTNDEGLGFLERRGLRDDALTDRFQLGLANRTLGYRLPKTNRKKGAAIRTRLQNLGVLRESGHEHLNGSLVVPITDANGNVLQLYGRKIGDRLRGGTDLHLWLPGRPAGLFNVTAFMLPEIIVTDSVLNALTLIVHGIENIIGVAGLDADTNDLVAEFREHNTKKAVLAFRRTTAGDDAAEKLAKTLGAVDVEVHRLVLPAEMDTNDFALSVADPRGAFAQLLRNTEWLSGKPVRLNVPTKRTMDAPTAMMPITDMGEPTKDDELVMVFEDRRWRIRGLEDNRARGTLKLNLFVSRVGAGFHVDRFDLYSARHRSSFVKLTATEIGVEEAVIKKDLGRVLLATEQAQEEFLQRDREPEPVQAELTAEDREAALQFLRDPNLLHRITQDFSAVGVVGETNNLLLGYLVATSRLLTQPLAVVIQSSSAAGKSSLMNATLSFIPDEAHVGFSAMTGQSLFYMGSSALKHKVLSIAEEEGSAKASYSLKLLQSEGTISIASTSKEPGSGKLVSQSYRVEGPVAIMTSTTAADVDEELLNRCLVLMVDESPEQTARIHAQQRHQMTLDGLLAHEARAEVVRLHQNVQRLLRSIKVVLPAADILSFPDLRVRARRDHRKLLGLVEVVALLHQHQRQLRRIEHGDHVVEYIEATDTDIEVARRLLDHVGGVGVDDLPPATRKLLVMLDGFVSELAAKNNKARPEIRFSRWQVREALGVGDTQAKVHLRRLVDAEFILAHRAPHGRGVIYSLAFNGATHTYDGERSGHGRPLVGPRSAQGRGEVGTRSEESTPPRKAAHGKAGVGAPRKRNTPPSQKSSTVRTSRRGKT